MKKKLLKFMSAILVATMVVIPMEIPNTPISTVIEAEAGYALPSFPKAKAGTYTTKKKGSTTTRTYYTNKSKKTTLYTVSKKKYSTSRQGKLFDVVVYTVKPGKSSDSDLVQLETSYSQNSSGLSKASTVSEVIVPLALEYIGAGPVTDGISLVYNNVGSAKTLASLYDLPTSVDMKNGTITHRVTIEQTLQFVYVKTNGASNKSWILGYTGNSVKVVDKMEIPLNKKVKGSRYKTKTIKYTVKSAGYDTSASHAIDYKMDWGNYYGCQQTACYHNIHFIKMQKKKGSQKTYNMKINGLTGFIH